MLIPFDKHAAENLEKTLSGKVFRDVTTFIDLYNSGIINRKNDEVRDFAARIVDTYKDVREKAGRITFISEEEIIAFESIAVLTAWATIAKAKREVKEAIEKGELTDASLVLLADDGTLNEVTTEGEAAHVTSLGGDKLFARNEDVTALTAFSSFGTEKDDRFDGHLFKAADIANIDTSFLSNLPGVLPSI